MLRISRLAFWLALIVNAKSLPSSEWKSFIHPDLLNQYLGKSLDYQYSDDNFEGDIAGIEKDTTQKQLNDAEKNVIKNERLRWTDGIVPYNISDTFRSLEKENIIGAMELISSATDNCIRFINRTTEQHHLHFLRGIGCSSFVGRQGGEQIVSLTVGCLERETIGGLQHKILHALGFYHEMSRSDRDKHVVINWDNINESNKVQFQIHTDADMLGLPYDYESVMHYPFNAFAKNPNLPTIIPTTKNARIGQTKNLSPIDILRIQLAYKCNGASSDQQSDTLNPGQKLLPGESLHSKNRKVFLILQTDGNLVLRRSDNNAPIWVTRTWQWPVKVSEFVIQEDGNMVLYDEKGQRMWSSFTARRTGAKLSVWDDGSITLYKNELVYWGYWNNGTNIGCKQTGQGSLKPGQELLPGTSISTNTRKTTLRLTKSELALIELSDDSSIWETPARGWQQPISKCVMQEDGNLVITSEKEMILWESGTWDHPGAEFTFQDDGNVYIHKGQVYYLAYWKKGKNLSRC